MSISLVTATPADAFAYVPVDTAIDPPWSTSSDAITFPTYLDNTGIGVLLGPASNPFAQLGLGINVSALG